MHLQWDEDKLYLNCSIQPKAREDRIVGITGDAVKIRITATPTDGKANSYLIKYLAGQFQVKRSAITIISGHTSRIKRLCIVNPGNIPDALISIKDDLSETQ